MKICDLILGPPTGRVRLVDHLEEAVERPQVEQVEADTELEGMWSDTAWIQDLVLGGPIRTSSLATSLFLAMGLIEDDVNAMTTNGVRWGTRSVLATALLHFPELEVELELLGSWRNVDMIGGLVDALWSQTCQASESLVAFIPLSIAHGPSDDMGE
jgi:hypothetical protein